MTTRRNSCTAPMPAGRRSTTGANTRWRAPRPVPADDGGPHTAPFVRRRLPPQRHAPPHESRSESREREEISPPDPPGSHALVERDRDRGGGRVPVALDIVVDLVVPQAEGALHHLRDAKVGLMRDEEGQLGGSETEPRQDGGDRLGH